MFLDTFEHLKFVDTEIGWMPIFDKSKTKSWDEKIYARVVEFDGKTIHVIGL